MPSSSAKVNKENLKMLLNCWNAAEKLMWLLLYRYPVKREYNHNTSIGPVIVVGYWCLLVLFWRANGAISKIMKFVVEFLNSIYLCRILYYSRSCSSHKMVQFYKFFVSSAITGWRWQGRDSESFDLIRPWLVTGLN